MLPPNTEDDACGGARFCVRAVATAAPNMPEVEATPEVEEGVTARVTDVEAAPPIAPTIFRKS